MLRWGRWPAGASRFFLVGGRVAVAAIAANAIRDDVLFGQKAPVASHEALEQRVADVLQAYDAQGNHRTGTEIDKASAKWLADQARQYGTEVSRTSTVTTSIVELSQPATPPAKAVARANIETARRTFCFKLRTSRRSLPRRTNDQL